MEDWEFNVQLFSDTFYDNFLLFTDTYQKQIYQMSIMTGDFNAVPLSGHDNPIGVNYDPMERKIYWTDVSARVIKRSNINGSEEETVRHLNISECGWSQIRECEWHIRKSYLRKKRCWYNFFKTNINTLQ